MKTQVAHALVVLLAVLALSSCAKPPQVRSFWCRVQSATDLRPLGRVRIELVGFDREVVETKRTDTQGYVGFIVGERSRPYPQYIRVTAEGHATLYCNVRPGHGDRDKARVIIVEPQGDLIVVPKGPSAIDVKSVVATCEQEHVWLRDKADLYTHQTQHKWHAERSGTHEYIFSGLPAEVPLTLVAYGTRGEDLSGPCRVELCRGEPRTFPIGTAIDFPVGTDISGLVTDYEGSPVSGITVWLVPEPGCVSRGEERYFRTDERPAKKALSREDGSFVLRSVELGKWWIGPSPSSEAGAGRAALISIESLRREYTVVVPIEDRASICGVIPGKGSASIFVTLWDSSPSNAAVTTDGDAFNLLVPKNENLAIRVWDLESGSASSVVEATSGTTGLVLEFERPTMVRGSAAPGANRSGLVVAFERSSPIPYYAVEDLVGGSFEFELPPGQFDIIAYSGGMVGVQAGVDTTAGSVVTSKIQLEDACSVVIGIRGESGVYRYTLLLGDAVIWRGDLQSGSRVEHDVPCGRLHIEIVGNGGRWGKSVDVFSRATQATFHL